MNLKLTAWNFLHNKNKFWSDFRKKLHILTVEKSEYYEECEKFYSTLDVKDKIVVDIGCDFGTTPMYFLNKGATNVFGYSKDKQYFHNIHYRHHNINKEPSAISTIICTIKRVKTKIELSDIVLKSDCEGCEWNFTKEFIESFDDWIIAVHTPITNESLYQYIKENGINIGNQISGKNRIVEEIGIYKKVLK